jgi:hypothetical protein
MDPLTWRELAFLADLVGGTGTHCWGEVAAHHQLATADVEVVWRKLEAARTDAGIAEILTEGEGR